MLFAGLRVMMINAVDIILLINFDSAECAFMGEDAECDKGENKFYNKNRLLNLRKLIRMSWWTMLSLEAFWLDWF